MSGGTLTAIKCLLGIFLTVVIYGVFLSLYKSTLIQHIHNPYIGIVILVVALLVVIVAGFVLAFKLMSRWD